MNNMSIYNVSLIMNKMDNAYTKLNLAACSRDTEMVKQSLHAIYLCEKELMGIIGSAGELIKYANSALVKSVNSRREFSDNFDVSYGNLVYEQSFQNQNGDDISDAEIFAGNGGSISERTMFASDSSNDRGKGPVMTIRAFKES